MLNPKIRNSPIAVLEAINRYCHEGGTLFDIACALEVDVVRFREVIDWYLTAWHEPLSDELPDPQTLLNIILLQLIKSNHAELLRQKAQIEALEKALKRPYKSPR